MAGSKTRREGLGFGEVIRLSWPTSLAMLNTTLLRFVDGLMVSRVGPAPFSAQFLGGMFAFIPESFATGMLTVVNTYVSQNFGAGRHRQSGRYGLAGLSVALVFAAAIAPLAFIANHIFNLFGHAADVTALETMYFQYMVLSVLVTLPARALEQFFFGIHRPKIVLVASVLANVVNVVAIYILIFGKLGFPAMGLQGAAIGNLFSWTLQLAVLLGAFLAPAIRRQFATHLWRAVRLRHCLDIFRIGWPAGVQLCNDVATWGLFTAALVGRFGTEHLAASTAAMRYLGISFMPAVGIGVATTAMVGKSIAQGLPDRARRRTHAALIVAMIYMGLCGILFYFFRHGLVDFFVRVSPEEHLNAARIVAIGQNVLLCAAVFQLFDAVGIVYIGALRGAGDTFWPMLMTIVLSWGVTLGGGAAMVFAAPQWTSLGPWIAASLYVVALGAMVAWRFEGGAWRKIDLLGRMGRAGLAAATTLAAASTAVVEAPPPPQLLPSDFVPPPADDDKS